MAMMMMERVVPDADALLSGILKMGISEKNQERQGTSFKQESGSQSAQQNYARMNDTATFNQTQTGNSKQSNGEQSFDVMNDFRSNGVETECEEMKAAAAAAASQAAVNVQVHSDSQMMPPPSNYDGKGMTNIPTSSKASLEAYRRYLQPGLPRQLSYPDEVYMSTGQMKLKEDYYAMQSQSLNALDQQEGSPDVFFRSANMGLRPTPMNQLRMNQQYQHQLNAVNSDCSQLKTFTPRKYRLNLQKLCGFCKKNGEAVSWYTSHNLKEPNGKILCPVLRAFQCPECQATGDSAHTIRYCPKNEKAEAFQTMMNMKYLRSTLAKRRGSGHNLTLPPSHNLSPTSPSFFPSQYLDMDKNAINWANANGQWVPMDNSGNKMYNGMSQNQPINIPRRQNLFQF